MQRSRKPQVTTELCSAQHILSRGTPVALGISLSSKRPRFYLGLDDRLSGDCCISRSQRRQGVPMRAEQHERNGLGSYDGNVIGDAQIDASASLVAQLAGILNFPITAISKAGGQGIAFHKLFDNTGRGEDVFCEVGGGKTPRPTFNSIVNKVQSLLAVTC